MVFIPDRQVDQQRAGGLDHRDRTRQYTGIMPTTGLELHVFALCTHSVLHLQDGRRGLEYGAKMDGLAVGDAALHAAGAVDGGAHLMG